MALREGEQEKLVIRFAEEGDLVVA